MSDKTQSSTKTAAQKPQTEAELAQALGKAEAKPEVKAEAKTEASTPVSSGVTLEQILNNLPEKSRKQIESISDKQTAFDIAKDYFAVLHPEGLKVEFEKALPETIRKLADQFMVSLDGKQITAKFPNSNGSEAVAELTDPNAVKTKGSGERNTERWNGASVKGKDGQVMNYEGPGPMAKALGYATKGYMFHDTTDCFVTPFTSDEHGNGIKDKPLAPIYALDMTKMAARTPTPDNSSKWDKSKGLHITAI